jgi:PIN domain nuclease of toxin-antitoxin system
MSILLDTHIFLWYVSGDARLPAAYLGPISDRSNRVYVSAVSIWEATIKHQLGRLPLPAPPQDYLPRQRRLHGFRTLKITERTVLELVTLPPLHADPFDRLLVCQAIHYGLTVATVDAVVRSYPVVIL